MDELDEPDARGVTPIMHAITFGQDEVARRLISHGVDVTSRIPIFNDDGEPAGATGGVAPGAPSGTFAALRAPSSGTGARAAAAEGEERFYLGADGQWTRRAPRDATDREAGRTRGAAVQRAQHRPRRKSI